MLKPGYTDEVDVKGTAFIARRAYLVATHGQDAFDAFAEAWGKGDPEFEADVLPTTTIPSAVFLRFNDAVIEHFYEGNVSMHWEFGRASAEWALRQGPYKAFFKSKRIEDFLRTASSLWRAYYSEGTFEAKLDPATNVVHATIEVPAPDAHVHFELNVMGYLHRALELTGAVVTSYQALEGFSRGDDSVHYAFALER